MVTQRMTGSVKAHKNVVSSLDFFPDDHGMVTAGGDGVLKCWSTSPSGDLS